MTRSLIFWSDLSFEDSPKIRGILARLFIIIRKHSSLLHLYLGASCIFFVPKLLILNLKRESLQLLSPAICRHSNPSVHPPAPCNCRHLLIMVPFNVFRTVLPIQNIIIGCPVTIVRSCQCRADNAIVLLTNTNKYRLYVSHLSLPCCNCD